MNVDRKRDLAFQKARRIIARHLGTGRLDLAYSLARLLIVNYGWRAQSWYMLAWVCDMQNYDEEAAVVRVDAQHCTDNIVYSDADMRRDVLLDWLDWRKPDQTFWRMLANIRLQYADDTNRYTYTHVVEGRAHYAEGSFDSAGKALWHAYNNQTDPQLRYNTLLPYLKALIMRGIASQAQLNELFNEIVRGAATYGSRRIVMRGRLCMRGTRGCKLDDALQRMAARLGR